MELRHLRYFIAVAEEKHMTRAAERLGIQQPPLSMQIRALEQELDVQLFRRTAARRRTDRCRRRLSRPRPRRSSIRSIVRSRPPAAPRAASKGRVVVGFTSSAPFHPFVPRVIRAFREMSPLVSLVLEESGSSELVQGLHNEEIDAAFIRSPVADVVGLTVRPLLRGEDGRRAAEGTSARERRSQEKTAQSAPRRCRWRISPTETFILYKRPGGPGLYDTIITACRGAGFSPHVGQEAPRIISTLNLVAAGLGVSLVPESLRRLQMDGVVYRELADNAQLTAPLILACRARRERSGRATLHRSRAEHGRAHRCRRASCADVRRAAVQQAVSGADAVHEHRRQGDAAATSSHAPGMRAGRTPRLRQRRPGAAHRVDGALQARLADPRWKTGEDLLRAGRRRAR